MDQTLFNFLIAFIIGFLFTVGGLYYYFKTRRFLQNGVKTEGKVVDYKIENGDTETYKPIIEYQTTENKTIQKASEYSFSSKRVFKLNEIVIIFYDRNNNEEFVIDSFLTKTLLPVSFTIIGLVVLITAIGLYLDLISI